MDSYEDMTPEQKIELLFAYRGNIELYETIKSHVIGNVDFGKFNLKKGVTQDELIPIAANIYFDFLFSNLEAVHLFEQQPLKCLRWVKGKLRECEPSFAETQNNLIIEGLKDDVRFPNKSSNVSFIIKELSSLDCKRLVNEPSIEVGMFEFFTGSRKFKDLDRVIHAFLAVRGILKVESDIVEEFLRDHKEEVIKQLLKEAEYPGNIEAANPITNSDIQIRGLDKYFSTPDDLFNTNAQYWYFKFMGKDRPETDKPVETFLQALHEVYFFIKENYDAPFTCIEHLKSVTDTYGFNEEERLIVVDKVLGVLFNHPNRDNYLNVYIQLTDFRNDISPYFDDPEIVNHKWPFDIEEIKSKLQKIENPKDRHAFLMQLVFDFKAKLRELDEIELAYYQSEGLVNWIDAELKRSEYEIEIAKSSLPKTESSRGYAKIEERKDKEVKEWTKKLEDYFDRLQGPRSTGWEYAFLEKTDYSKFIEVLADVLSGGEVPKGLEGKIKIRKGSKTKVLSLLGTIHNQSGRKESLTRDKDYLKAVRTLDDAANETDLPRALTRNRT